MHNKGKLVDSDGDGEPDSVSYPGGSTANYKVTIGFRSEFIIDSEGNFLNEIDSEGTTENGIVNGASFNYANENDNIHKQLDVDSVKPYDPEYHSKVAKQYISPNNIGGDILSRAKDAWEDYWENGNGENWDDSYWNDSGYYSKNGASAHDRVEEARDELRDMIKNQS
ncbi:Protein of uncharacterised function (DUF3114) [Streptococcus criceti]|uniref:Uncharacterized protein n=1 Tax=Streptococcus criceti HS-6 TaxID=873449 RepID=G5JN99_STRCG|nr:DUF3114 domain-containing protein [Streptococcus criceti]EHI74120.1 hypothetical protein STRCR_0136 [Streptococcus criceti HS-6]SUN41649.1 Protein of uncharacterised function (DUF3114) [Streptococcus criceti]